MHREDTLNYYQQKVKALVTYVRQHLDQDLSVKALAERSNISTFHFHRIVKAYLGMPLGTYINHLRLDTAANIIRYSDESIKNIATRVGYSDISAFSKSFAREFGISPSDYRTNKDSFINSTVDFHFANNAIEKFELRPKVKTIPNREVLYIKVKGIYGGEECYKAWDILLDYASSNKLQSWNSEAFTVYLDDPDEVGQENCTFDCCFTVKKLCNPPEPIATKQVEGGKYLTFRYKGPYEGLWEVYNLIFQDYLLNKYQLRDSPVIEKYLKYSAKTKPDNILTEICIPIA